VDLGDYHEMHPCTVQFPRMDLTTMRISHCLSQEFDRHERFDVVVGYLEKIFNDIFKNI